MPLKRNDLTGESLSSVSDERLMRAYALGDTVSGEVLATRYSGKLCGFFRRACRGSGRSEDLAQDTLMRMVKSRADYRTDALFRPWIYTIAYNLLRDEARKAGGGRRPSGSPVPAQEAPSTEPMPGRNLEALETKAAVQEALDLLSEELRSVVLLKHYEGLTAPEVAGVLGIPVGTVWSRMSHATDRLRQTLRQRGVTP